MRTARIIMAGECRFGSFGATSGRLAIVGFTGHDRARRASPRSSPSSISAASSTSPATSWSRARWRSSRARCAALARDWPLWISVDQEGGRVARLKRPFTEWPPVSTLGRSGDEALAERFAAALARRAAGRRHQPRLRAGARRPHEPGESRHRRPRAGRASRRRRRASARVIVRELQDAGVAACGKHFPGHGDTSVRLARGAAGRRARSPAARGRRARAVPRGDRGRRRDDHDRARARAGARRRAAGVALAARSSTACSKSTLGFHGRRHQRRPRDEGGQRDDGRSARPTVDAIAAGCDAVLLCNTTIDEQVGALEAVIRAVESRRLPQSRIDDAFARQRRVKERFSTMAPRPPCSLDVDRLRRAPGGRRGDGRAGDDRRARGRADQVPAVRPGSRVALVAPASPFERDGVRCRARRAAPPRLRARLRRARLRQRGVSRRLARVRARARCSGRWTTHGRRRRHRRARRLRQRRDAAAARRRPRSARARTAFVGYSDVTSLHMFLNARRRPRVDPRADDRRPSGAQASPAYDRARRSCAVAQRPSRSAS